MHRTLASVFLALFFVAAPILTTAQGGSSSQQSGQPGSMTGSATEPQSPGSGRTYGEVNQTSAPGYRSDEAGRGFDFGWLGLLGLAGLMGLRHTHRDTTVTTS